MRQAYKVKSEFNMHKFMYPKFIHSDLHSDFLEIELDAETQQLEYSIVCTMYTY